MLLGEFNIFQLFGWSYSYRSIGNQDTLPLRAVHIPSSSSCLVGKNIDRYMIYWQLGGTGSKYIRTCKMRALKHIWIHFAIARLATQPILQSWSQTSATRSFPMWSRSGRCLDQVSIIRERIFWFLSNSRLIRSTSCSKAPFGGNKTVDFTSSNPIDLRGLTVVDMSTLLNRLCQTTNSPSFMDEQKQR